MGRRLGTGTIVLLEPDGQGGLLVNGQLVELEPWRELMGEVVDDIAAWPRDDLDASCKWVEKVQHG